MVGFEFYFDDEGHKRSWFVRNYPENGRTFLLEERDHGKLVSEVSIPYIDLSVSNICELYIKMITHAEQTIEELIGEKIKVVRIIIEKDVGYIDDFIGCSFVSSSDKPKEEIKIQEQNGEQIGNENNDIDNETNYKVKVSLKDDKYPFINTEDINLAEIGGVREKGEIIYISGKLVKEKGYLRYVEFKRIGQIGLKLENAKIIRTEKGTLVIKHEPTSKLYIVEIPSGYRGDVRSQILNGECFETSVEVDLNYTMHIFCNGNAEIQYQIYGRTRTSGYGKLEDLFGKNLSGKIRIKDDKIEIIHDEELDKLLS
jgi:hypothetical protein